MIFRTKEIGGIRLFSGSEGRYLSMDENPKSGAPETADEKAKELTPEELNNVTGGISESMKSGAEGWIEINSFKWNGE